MLLGEKRVLRLQRIVGRMSAGLGIGGAHIAVAVLGVYLGINPAMAQSSGPSWVYDIGPGTWGAISRNTLSDVDPEDDPSANPNYPSSAPWHGSTGQRSVIIDWNGGAYAQNFGSFGSLLLTGGGHAAYQGNEVYAFDLDTRLWTRVNDPYTGSYSNSSNGAYSDGSPLTVHTMDALSYHPATKSIVRLKGTTDSYAGNGQIVVAFMLDLETKAWRRSRVNPVEIITSGISCYDTNRDVFWFQNQASANWKFQKYDPNGSNGDGTVGTWTNYPASYINSDGAGACDPVNDVFVYTQFRSDTPDYMRGVYVRDLSNPSAPAVQISPQGTSPESGESGAHGWEWSNKRQAFIFWRRGGGVHELRLVSGSPQTGTWRWTQLTSGSNSVVPQSMALDRGVYSRFQIATLGDEEVGVVVNREDGPVYAFRIPDADNVTPSLQVSVSASPSSVTSGQTSTLTWSVPGATSCAASGGWSGTKSGSGSQVVGPLSASATFTLDCSNGSGSTGRGSASITVGSAPQPNRAPTISGSPAATVVAGDYYRFAPTSGDADDDNLTFSIVNKPSWASFSTSTGELDGTPGNGDVGTTSNVRITVSDGAVQTSLSAFSVTVVAAATGGGTISWLPPLLNADGSALTDLAGYKIHYGSSSRNYDTTILINYGGVTNYLVENLVPGTYYFAVTSFDAAGNESVYSAEVVGVIGTAVTEPPVTQPPVTQPPVTQPPTTESPSTGEAAVAGTEESLGSGGAAAGLAEILWLLMIALARGIVGRRSHGPAQGKRAQFRSPREGFRMPTRFSILQSTGILVAVSLAATGWAGAADFQTRCAGAGVVKCVGFDSSSDIPHNSVLRPASDGAFRGTIDASIRASGNGSLRFEVPSNSDANASGSYLDSLGGSFGQNSKFYVQFRQRFSDAMVNTNFAPGSGWKQVIFHAYNKSCGSVELTTQNIYLRGFPQMYTDCGGRSLQTNLGNGDALLQQGDYDCHYQSQNGSDCGWYVADEWITFYYEIEIGNWYQPNSNIRAYMAYEGQPLKQFIDIRNFALSYNNSSSDSYQQIQLTTYHTNKDSSQSHPTAYVWYDELIVSTQPIAPADGSIPPQAPPPPQADTTAPAAPTSVEFLAD